MTPQEIQALINAKIAGQGSAVDVGGALPKILSEILALASAGGGQANLLEEDSEKPGYVKGIFHFLTSWGERHVLTADENRELSETTIVCYHGEVLYSRLNTVPESVAETIESGIGQELANLDAVFGTYSEADGVVDGFIFVISYLDNRGEHIIRYYEL